jgi:hypothetical protein
MMAVVVVEVAMLLQLMTAVAERPLHHSSRVPFFYPTHVQVPEQRQAVAPSEKS